MADLVSKGLTTCEGCGMELIARSILDVLGQNTIMLTPPSCSAILTGFGSETGWKVPAFQSNLENIAAYCSGISVALEHQNKTDINVVALAGDGGTVDIGLQALSGAVERGHKFIYVCYDNEAYMNTGIQRSGSTPVGAWTTTTPGGKKEPKKNIVEMLLAQGIPYVATASVGYIDDFKKKVAKAREIDGPAYIHTFSPCPPGWRAKPRDTIKIAKLAVDTNLFPLFEAIDGEVRVTRKVRKVASIKEYLELQGRFRNIRDEEVESLATDAENYYNKLLESEAK
ncbi:MAG: thiamine pyrophosphate-dependent enzyme [Bacillota bacterium]|jgi:pyruvate/2-oxoacid:ferredoxin oxidoreductase beta subunit|nr:thiamine pyrophosphate-dependent enzyme [Bacillota bacterium]HHT91039.1 pyruvate synthase subunit beta [Bacillota bacterium]